MNILSKAKAGTLLSVESGEYSDHHVTGFFVVLQEFSPRDELNSHLAENTSQKEPYGFDRDTYLARLISRGLLLEIPYGTIHTDSYDRASDFRFTPVKPS